MSDRSSTFWNLKRGVVQRLYQELWPNNAAGSLIQPSELHFKSVLTACFWASQLTEEGRPVVGSIVLAPAQHCSRHMLFTKPVECTANNIHALLHVANRDISGLAVWEGKICGVALKPATNAVMITIPSPGKLLIRVGKRVAASLSDNLLRIHDAPELASLLSPLPPVSAGEKSLAEFVKEFSISLRRAGHGGILIFMIGENDPSCMQIPYALADDQNPLRDWKPVEQADGLEREVLLGKERSLLDSIAYLANVDGAVVVDAVRPTRKVIGFGAKILCKQDVVQVELLEFPTYKPRSVKLEKLGGTRHRSSAAYAWHRPGELVLVVSQDGTSSVCLRRGKADRVVQVYRGFDAGFPLDEATLETAQMIFWAGNAASRTGAGTA
jgi:hypothetical protein